jgi:hypothetical protein
MATYRFKVTATPSVRRALKRNPSGTFRGYTTVSKKTATVLKKYGVEGQLRYYSGGYVGVDSARLPESLVKKASGTTRTVPLHRLAYTIETGRSLPKTTRNNTGDSIVIDHGNRVRDDNRIKNLTAITGRENIRKIPKNIKRAGSLRANVNVQATSLGKYNSTAQKGAETKKLTYDSKRWRQAAEKRLASSKADVYKVAASKAGKASAAKATPEYYKQRAKNWKSSVAKKPDFYKNREKKRQANIIKKYGSLKKFYSRSK